MRRIVTLLLSLVLCLTICACGSEENKAKTEENIENTNNQDIQESVVAGNFNTEELSDSACVLYNGVEIWLGAKYEDVKGNLGNEAKPSETITICGPGQTTSGRTYYYDGLSINVDSTEKIIEMLVDGNIAKIKSGIEIGQNPDEIKAKYSIEPEFEFEGGLIYSFAGSGLSCDFDENNQAVRLYVSLSEEE